MNDDELLEALDRRARHAVMALEDATASAPPLQPRSIAVTSRRWTPLLVAAALVVLALVGAGLLLADADEESTVAGEHEVPIETGTTATRLALPDPDHLGYRVRAAFGASGSFDDGPTALVHGPIDDPDPWASAIVTMQLPFDDRSFVGERVDIGGPEAVLGQLGHLTHLTWRDGEGTHQLYSATQTQSALVAAARRAVDAGWSGDGPLPGRTLLHEGPAVQLSPTLEFAAGGPTPWAGVAYDDLDGDQDFVIGWRTGGTDVLHATHAMVGWERTAFGDAEALVSEGTLDRASYASWLGDGTVIQVVTYGDVHALLAQLADALEPLEATRFEDMVATHPPADGTQLLDRPSFGDDGAPVAQVSVRDGRGAEHRVEITEQRGGYALMIQLESGGGVSGSGAPLPDLQTPLLQAGGSSAGPDGAGATPVVVAGVLPVVEDELESLTVVDRTSGARVPVLQATWGQIPGSDQRLVLVLVDAEPSTARLDVTYPTDDGEVTWRL